ncbi:MAG: phage tail family protein [Paludibacteraceae bacterium]|nr:phage tail family protein [Paludibacteraceae bacterium]
MDNKVIIKIIRDDLRQFIIDNEYWHIPSIDGLQNFGFFENDLTLINNAVTDGAMIASHRMGTIDRTIHFNNKNPRKNNEADRMEILKFFSANHTYKIYVTYLGVTRWCEGMILKMDLPTQNINWRLDCVVTFLCNNPYMKSYDDFGKDIASVVPMVGFPYLSRIDTGKPSGYFAFSKYVVLNNDGDSSAPFRAFFKANGAVLNPKLIVNDYYVRVIDTLIEGDEIEMDFGAMPPTIKKNGTNWIGHCDRNSSFDKMILDIGDTEVSFDADDGSNLLSVSIYFNKLYCGI